MYFTVVHLLELIKLDVYGQDQFDCMDFSDNEIVKLENFPYLSRLGTLLLNNNRITRINPNIGGKQGFIFIVLSSLNLRRLT